MRWKWRILLNLLITSWARSIRRYIGNVYWPRDCEYNWKWDGRSWCFSSEPACTWRRFCRHYGWPSRTPELPPLQNGLLCLTEISQLTITSIGASDTLNLVGLSCYDAYLFRLLVFSLWIHFLGENRPTQNNKKQKRKEIRQNTRHISRSASLVDPQNHGEVVTRCRWI